MKSLFVLFIATVVGLSIGSLITGTSPAEIAGDIVGMHPQTANFLISTSFISLPLIGLLMFSIRTSKKNKN